MDLPLTGLAELLVTACALTVGLCWQAATWERREGLKRMQSYAEASLDALTMSVADEAPDLPAVRAMVYLSAFDFLPIDVT